jgi:hypothetical protein
MPVEEVEQEILLVDLEELVVVVMVVVVMDLKNRVYPHKQVLEAAVADPEIVLVLMAVPES